jgi:hypothetical protein
MVTFQRLINLLTVILFIVGCSKDASMREHSFLQVRFEDDMYPIDIEEMNATWSLHNQTAEMLATGYRFERFRLHLSAVHDTGNVVNPGIENIFFTDGLDFVPDSVNAGFIHISQLDSNRISGDFKVSMHDDFNGSENKIVVGQFRINNN